MEVEVARVALLGNRVVPVLYRDFWVAALLGALFLGVHVGEHVVPVLGKDFWVLGKDVWVAA